MIKNVLLLALVAVAIGTLPMAIRAQEGQGTHHLLDTGDMMPDYTLPIENYPTPTVRLSDLRGKLVILDFWGVSCAPCIAAMPKMQALQERFGERIQVVLVTRDTREQVERMKTRSSTLREVKLPSIIGDSTLFDRFPIATLPAHIWIDPEGNVSQITNGHNTTAEHIAAFLAGETVRLPVKHELKDIDQDIPVWLEGNGRHVEKLQYYSFISSRITIDGGQHGTVYNPAIGMPDQVRAINQDILVLYKLAYGESAIGPFNENNRVVIDVKRPERLMNLEGRANHDHWRRENTYCYELKVPSQQAPRLFEYMRQDLERYFDIRGSIETVLKPALVLRSVGDTSRLRTRMGARASRSGREIDEPAVLQNQPMKELIRILEDLCAYLPERDRPVVDQSGIDFDIDIQLINKAASLDELRRSLLPHGLDLVPEEAGVPCLVLRDR